MLHYKKLPKKTPVRIVAGILAIGGCLGFGIVVSYFISIYAFIGLFGAYFYPSANITLTGGEALYLGMLTIAAGITVTALGFLAYDMNILSKKALAVSRFVLLPITVTALLVGNQSHFIAQEYRLSTLWMLFYALVIPLCGVLPALFLQTPGARKVHSR